MNGQIQEQKTRFRVPRFIFAAVFVALGLGLVLVLSTGQSAWATAEQRLSLDPTPTLPCITGSVTLQGRPAPPAPSWSVPVRVVLYEAGTQNVLNTIVTQTNQSGVFFNICWGDHDLWPPNWWMTDTYDISVKNPHTLRNRKNGVYLESWDHPFIDFGTLLEGDANDSNKVEIFDFSILATSYRSVPGDPNWDPRADFNENDRVEIFDFSLLATNYGREGDIIVTTLAASAQMTNTVDLVVWPMTYTAKVGEVFALPIKAVAGEQGVDGVSLYLDFDPALLRVVDQNGLPTNQIEPQPLMPNVLLNQVNNAKGEIEFHAGRDFAAPPPTGTFPVALIRFKALNATAGTPVAFGRTLPNRTDVAFEGYSVLGDLYDGWVKTASAKLLLFFILRNVTF